VFHVKQDPPERFAMLIDVPRRTARPVLDTPESQMIAQQGHLDLH